MKKIKLGDKVRDPITGFEGIAYSRISYLQGCDRIGIQASVIVEKGKAPIVPELYHVDEPQLDLVKILPKKKKTTTGGASYFGSSQKR
jgi:hypothetical protein